MDRLRLSVLKLETRLATVACKIIIPEIMNVLQYCYHDSGLSFGRRSKLGNVVRKKMLGRGKLRILSGFMEKLFRYGNIVQKEATCDYSE